MTKRKKKKTAPSKAQQTSKSAPQSDYFRSTADIVKAAQRKGK